MTRQALRAEARRLSKLWVGTRLKGPRAARKSMEAQIATAHWSKLREHPLREQER